MNIAENIGIAIKGSGKNHTQVAKEVGVNISMISDYIAGRARPSYETLRKLCQVLDCNYEDILGKL